jgi:prophage DNA circulation protein
MSWTERMATASFRGFEFLTDSHDAKGGRRLVVHEYPGSEEPSVEDMGGKASDNHLNAYFIGEDYDLARDEFLTLLNTPGADWLRHPWRGLLWVRAHTWSIHESNDKGGYATVSVDFLPGGNTPELATADPVDEADAAQESFADAAEADFALLPMSAAGMTAFIASVQQQLERVRDVIALATLPLTYANQVMNVIQGVKGDLATLMAMPSRYAAALRSLTNAFGLTDLSGADRQGGGQATPRTVFRACALSTQAAMIAASPATAIRTAGALAIAADSAALRTNMAREATLRARLMIAAAAQIALADYLASNDRDAALASVVTTLDALLPGMPDAVFQAAVSVRTTLITALSAQAMEPTTSRDIVAALPATLLAYRMGVDEAVFLAQNAVRHPLFVRGRIYG